MISAACHDRSKSHGSAADEHSYNEDGNSDNWEVLSDSDSGKDSPIASNEVIIDVLHRCKSTPNIPTYEETDEFSDIDSYLDVRSLQTEEQSVHVSPKGSSDDWSMISSTTGNLKKIPSFKDMLLKNGGDIKQDQARLDLQEKLKKTVVERKTITPSFVVSNDKHSSRLKRCGFSTGDLQSSTLYPTDVRQGPASIIPEEEVWGDTDAMEFYNQKALGSSSRFKGLKLRPDEAKRKEFSLSKKEMHKKS
jgi:hypothetical protein